MPLGAGSYDARVSAFVILSLVLAVLFIATTVVVVRELLRTVHKLSDQVKATTQRLVPLTDELQAELAVTAVEVEGLTKSIEQAQAQRSGRPKRKRTKTKR